MWPGLVGKGHRLVDGSTRTSFPRGLVQRLGDLCVRSLGGQREMARTLFALGDDLGEPTVELASFLGRGIVIDGGREEWMREALPR